MEDKKPRLPKRRIARRFDRTVAIRCDIQPAATDLVKTGILGATSILAATLPSETLGAGPIGHITGLGGVCVTSKNPKALATSYKDVLGINRESLGGAIPRYDAPGHLPMALWNVRAAKSDEIAGEHPNLVFVFLTAPTRMPFPSGDAAVVLERRRAQMRKPVCG